MFLSRMMTSTNTTTTTKRRKKRRRPPPRLRCPRGPSPSRKPRLPLPRPLTHHRSCVRRTPRNPRSLAPLPLMVRPQQPRRPRPQPWHNPRTAVWYAGTVAPEPCLTSRLRLVKPITDLIQKITILPILRQALPQGTLCLLDSKLTPPTQK